MAAFFPRCPESESELLLLLLASPESSEEAALLLLSEELSAFFFFFAAAPFLACKGVRMPALSQRCAVQGGRCCR